MPRPSIQERYAKDMKEVHSGVAVYHPIKFDDHSGRVGDVAFFNHEGTYRWLRNAFHSEVSQ
jgi:hypothetical protein